MMKIRYWYHRLYHRVRRFLPGPVRRILKTIGIESLAERYDPLRDPNYQWPLRGPLSGHAFKVGNSAER